MKLDILRAAFFTPMLDGDWGLPMLLKGPPGTSKTAQIKGLGRRYALHVERLSPAERGEGEFGVTPMLGQDGYLHYPPPEWVLRLSQDGEEAGIVFYDEVDKAPPALQPVLLGGIQEKTIGAHRFGPRVRVMAALNPMGMAGLWEPNAAVANRLGHLAWDSPDADDWGAWLVSGGASENAKPLDAKAEEKRVLAAWAGPWAKASGLAAAFAKRRPELLHKMPPDGDPAQSAAWPSPRSWEYATRARASAEVHGLNAVDTDEFISAFIGASAAGEWATWVEQADLPEPADVLDGKVTWKHDPARLDRTAAVLSSCAALVTPTHAHKRVERATALWGLLDTVAKDAKDLTVPTMRALVLAELSSKAISASRQVMAKLHAVVTSAKVAGG